jgi:hypothetical protein
LDPVEHVGDLRRPHRQERTMNDATNLSDPDPTALLRTERHILGAIGFVSLTGAFVLLGADVVLWLRAPAMIALGGCGLALLGLATELVRPIGGLRPRRDSSD